MMRLGRAAGAVAFLVALSPSVDGWAQSVQSDYNYDVHGRLTKATRPGATTDYTYDKAQNRTHATATLTGANGASVTSVNSSAARSSASAASVMATTMAPDGGSDLSADPASTADGTSSSSQVGAADVAANRAPTAKPGATDLVWQSTTVIVDPRSNDTDPDGDVLTIQSIEKVSFDQGRIDGVDLAAPPSDIGSATYDGASITYRAPFLSKSGTAKSSHITVVVWYTVGDGHGHTAQSYQAFNVYGPQ